MRITITDRGCEAVIDSLGAELKSFKDPAGKEYIWCGNPEYWLRSSPLLFPTIGNVRNNRTIINGAEYPMAKHGFAKESEFTVLEQGINSVTFSLSDNAFTHESYPFAFELRLTYELTMQSLNMTYQVINRDQRSMLYHIGAHPGFNCPLEENEVFEDYLLEFEKDELLESYVYDLENMCFFAKKRMVHGNTGKVLKLSKNLFDNDALYFYHTNSHSVKLKNPTTGRGIRMDYPDFSSIAFWTPIGGKAPFLCLEPWNGSGIFEDEDDCFSHKRDIQTLEAGKEKYYRLRITIL
ncbi:MAG: aldose 1-epimerase family protein [Lachnospiraceae bacterium]|nr:aldose 1-epimerase family protein [Lachnospiraceae bacterium]MDY4098152.1 aldose 1-epimerase family protein [Lachnospiraceae bacterium]